MSKRSARTTRTRPLSHSRTRHGALLVTRLDDPDLTVDEMLHISAEIGRAYDKQAETKRVDEEFVLQLHRQQILGVLKVVGAVALTVGAIAVHAYLSRDEVSTEAA